MGAVDEIRAAIEKLEGLRDGSTPGPWIGWKQYNPLYGQVLGVEAEDGEDVLSVKSARIEDAELVEVLHRTIDAQLAILRGGVAFTMNHPELHDEDILALARAINGAV